MDLNEFIPGGDFDEFFEDRMWTILSENTNTYVHTKLRQAKDNGDKDPIELLSEGVDQNPRTVLEQYWSRDSILNTPLFGHYMSRNHFQKILWNLHVSDPDETNPQKGEANHDPLFLVRLMVDMMQRNFCTKYRPEKELFLDKSTYPFKGRVHFKCYDPKNQTGSILNFYGQYT